MDAAPLPSVEEVMPNMDVTAVIDGKEVKLSDFALTEAQIASAEVVTMVNAETGETVQMSGVEFLQQLRAPLPPPRKFLLPWLLKTLPLSLPKDL